jgi:hypothetical protein
LFFAGAAIPPIIVQSLGRVNAMAAHFRHEAKADFAMMRFYFAGQAMVLMAC